MIRETFDQCLSGIDGLPSLRPDILRKAKAQTPEGKPLPFRRYAVAAAAVLLLCGSVLAVSGQWGPGGREDPIRTDNRYLAQPIETVLSMGVDQGSGETREPEEWNLFSWLNREVKYYPLLEHLAADSTTVSKTMQGEEKTTHIDSYYYDGETLIVTAAIANSKTEAYEPSERDRSFMKPVDTDPLELNLNDAEPGLKEKWEESVRNKTPMGLAMYSRSLEPGLRGQDHNMLSYEGGGGAGNFMGCICCPETGYESVCYIRYGEPLPDALRNVESFDVTWRVTATVTQYYFDGEALYSHSMYDYDRFDYIDINVVNNHAEKHTYSGQGTLRNKELYAKATVSGASVRLSLFGHPDSEDNVNFRFGKDYKGLLVAVQDDQGKTLAYDWTVFNPYDYDPENNSYNFPVTLCNDDNTVVEEFPPTMKLYIQPIHYAEAEKESMKIQESENEGIGWDEWGTEEGKRIAEEEAYTEEEEDGPPEIEPGTEPFAILTMEK